MDHTDEAASRRVEHDSMGAVAVPSQAHYGSQTQRARDNFFDSGLRPPMKLIHALALIKACAARVNTDLQLIDGHLAEAIGAAADEVLAGRWDDQFVVDLFQTGSGTSTNMNMNEVIASRANEILTGQRGGRSPVHPNDHVNLGQSSNDVIPTALHIAAVKNLVLEVDPALEHLEGVLKDKVEQYRDVHKIARTHLQDAVPITLGQSFSGYVRQIELGRQRLTAALPRLGELALGGTAVGTGLNTHPQFASRTIALIAERSGLPLQEALNHFEAQAARDAAVETAGALKTVAVSLVKIANDIRWLGSGPRCGLGELKLPELQPGSSIMPGKVNPVIPEAVIQMGYQIMANDLAVTLAGQAGNLELNVTMPLIAHNLLQAMHLLAGAARLLANKCLQGLAADRKRCSDYIEKSLALVTALVPEIGYDRAAEVAKRAYQSDRTVRQIVLEEKILPARKIEVLLGPERKH